MGNQSIIYIGFNRRFLWVRQDIFLVRVWKEGISVDGYVMGLVLVDVGKAWMTRVVPGFERSSTVQVDTIRPSHQPCSYFLPRRTVRRAFVIFFIVLAPSAPTSASSESTKPKWPCLQLARNNTFHKIYSYICIYSYILYSILENFSKIRCENSSNKRQAK